MILRRFWYHFAGTTCVSLGVLLAVVNGFLASWEHAAHGEHDIVARGGILLYVLLPQILAVSWFIVVGLVGLSLRRSGLSWWGVLGTPLAALVLAAALELLPPVFLLARALSPLPDSLRPATDFVLAGVLVIGGLATVRHTISGGPLNATPAHAPPAERP